MDNAEDAGGALGAAYEDPNGGRELARGAAYGNSGMSAFPPQLTGALSELLGPEAGADQERRAFWGGMLQGTKGGSGGEAMGNALKAQVEARDSQNKLKASYIPLIMQALSQNRANELGYAQFQQGRYEKLSPIINAALTGLQAEGQAPSLQQAHSRINEVGMQYGMQPQELQPYHYALAANAGPGGKNLSSYLQQLRVAAAPPAEGISKPGTNAAGQTVFQNPVQNSVGLPNAPGGPGGPTGTGVNPDKATVGAAEAGRGDIKGYGEALQSRVSAYGDMLQRLNAIGDNLDQFDSGKYAGLAGGFAAAVKDLTTRFPGASSDTVRQFANSVLGGNGKSPDPVASAQFAEALKAQEAIAQTKAMIGGDNGQRIGQQEVLMVAKNMPGNVMDPGAYKKFIEFMRGNQVNAMNKFVGWGNYVEHTDPQRLSVHAFDIPWEVTAAKQLQQGKFGALQPPEQAAAQPNGPVPAQGAPGGPPQPSGPGAAPQGGAAPVPYIRPPAPPAAAPSQAPAPAPAPRSAPVQVDLSQYEPGARVGPTGKVYVIEKGVPRPAGPRKSRYASGPVIDLRPKE